MFSSTVLIKLKATQNYVMKPTIIRKFAANFG